MASGDVLLVTKPLVPPWTDGAKNLARDLVVHATGTRFHCLVSHTGMPLGPNATVEAVYGAADGYAPGLRQNARVLARLLRPDAIPNYHFFFAPNPRTSAVARLVFALKTRRVIHTVVSRPVGRPAWFAGTHVAVSEHTADWLRRCGAPDVRVVLPGIADREPASADRPAFGISLGAQAALFAGDLTEGGGADVFVDAVLACPDTLAVMACRPKGAGHARREAELRKRLGARGVWLGVVPDMASLLASVDVIALPAMDLTGKVDLPLVLLEAMQAGRPVVVTEHGPLRELGGEGDGVLRVAPNAGAVAEGLHAATAVGLGVLAQRRVTEAFSAQAMAARYEAIYCEGAVEVG